jgi:hypothetical protein
MSTSFTLVVVRSCIYYSVLYYYTMLVFLLGPRKREREPGILFLTVEFHFVKLKRPAGMIQLMFITFKNIPDTLFYAPTNDFLGKLRIFPFNWTVFI